MHSRRMVPSSGSRLIWSSSMTQRLSPLFLLKPISTLRRKLFVHFVSADMTGQSRIRVYLCQYNCYVSPISHLSSVLNFPSGSDMARPRRHPVMLATTTKNLKYWRSLFETYSDEMISAIGASGRTKSVDIVRQLRITTLNNSQVIMGGTGVKLDPTTFPDVVGEYNFLVVWRLALPEWMFKWLRWGPSSKARFRIRSSRLLYEVRIWRKHDFCNAA